MNAFVNAVNQVPDARTENGAPTFSSSLNSCVDFFSKAGSMRANQEGLLQLFKNAFAEDPVVATKIVLWLRDVREGSGERQSFRSIVRYMINRPAQRDIFDQILIQLIEKTPELGRWDDLVDIVENFAGAGTPQKEEVSKTVVTQSYWVAVAAAAKIKAALDAGDGLCAKWMPRKGIAAHFLRTQFEWTPKYYRKRLVELSNTVEQLMCANRWSEIDFSKLPSVAQFRYQGAFEKHEGPRYKDFTAKAVSGEVKVNAGAIFPHVIAKQVLRSGTFNAELVTAQWNSLPNYVRNSSVIPMVDTSGSMGCEVSPGTSAIDVSVGLGLYCATKNTGVFKDVFVEFSTEAKICKLTTGSIVDKIRALNQARWQMTTNLQAAFNGILRVALENSVPASDMPGTLLILSDMEFNSACDTRTNFQVIQDKYRAAGYQMPNIVFWNLNARNVGNSPVRFDQNGAALVSGFSPSILTAVLEGDLKSFTPQAVMLKKLSNPRYDIQIEA